MQSSFFCVFVALVGFFAIVQSQWQVSIGKVGTKSLYLLESYSPATWNEAVKICKEKGLRLAALENAEENEIVSKFLANKTTVTGDVLHAWLDGTDNNSEGKWYWAGSNETISYSYWGEDEPVDSKDSNCMYMSDIGDESPIKWRTQKCEEKNFAFPLCQSM